MLGERWTLLIVRELLFAHPEPRRFGELLDELPGISRTLLTTRLRELERAGVVEARTNGSARAVRGWSLTERGVALGPALQALGEWGLEHSEDPTRADRREVRRRLSSLR